MTGVLSARELRVALRHGRRQHHSRSLGDFLTDLYLLAFLALMYGYVIVHAARQYLHSPTAGHGDQAERYWLGAAAVLAGAGFAGQGLRAVGPLLSTPAAYTWVVATPVSRRGWLLPRLAGLLLGAAVSTAALATAAAGAGLGSSLGWAALAGAGYGVAGAALCVVAQTTSPRWPRVVSGALAGIGAATALVVIVAHYAGVGLAEPAVPVAAALALTGIPAALVAAVLAVRALPRLDRAALTGGAGLAAAAVTAAIWLDPSMLSGVLETRRWRRVGVVSNLFGSRRPKVQAPGRFSRRFRRGGRIWVLLQAEVHRQARRPGALAIWAGLALAQYGIAITVPSVAWVTRLAGAYLAVNRLTGGLRTVSRSPGLRRALGGSDSTLRLVHLVVPWLGAILWWLLTWPAGPHLAGVEPLIVVGVVVAAYRAATKPPMSYGGAAVDTPFGLIPVDLIRQVIRGPDVLAVVIVIWSLLA
jgi:hypothetical protein